MTDTEETPRAKKKTFHAEDYTVGWICALPKEALSASLLLDEEYETILDDPTDQNAYSFGRMGDHNVVIAILPKGSYGQVQAAVVGTNLFRSFVSIRFCFLVGIGAGIPSVDYDIRLGDVVVSAPDGGTGAFVQFDFGSQNTDGTFRLKSRPVSPPVFLLNAVSKFETDHEQGNAPLSRYVSDVQQKQEHLRARFLYPGAENDNLFPPEYSCKAADGSGVCRGCDRSLVDPRRSGPRSSAAPVAHYGVIVHSNLANVVRILLASGAGVHVEDLKGQTALAVAAQNKATEAAALLLEAGAQPLEVPNNTEARHWLQTSFGDLIEQRLDPHAGFINAGDLLDKVYPPQRPRDQFKVYHYLKSVSGNGLPPHIIDMAGYWLVNKTQRSETLMITELEFYNTPYLRSAQVIGSPDSPARRIEFNITSHDQGWADTPTRGWPYDHSQTWFEASCESKDSTSDKALHLFGPEIVRNVRASQKWTRHQVFWPESLVMAFDCDMAGDNYTHCSREFNVDPVDKPPMLLKWIREIKPGDRVCVHMRARFPG